MKTTSANGQTSSVSGWITENHEELIKHSSVRFKLVSTKESRLLRRSLYRLGAQYRPKMSQMWCSGFEGATLLWRLWSGPYVLPILWRGQLNQPGRRKILSFLRQIYERDPKFCPTGSPCSKAGYESHRAESSTVTN